MVFRQKYWKFIRPNSQIFQRAGGNLKNIEKNTRCVWQNLCTGVDEFICKYRMRWGRTKQKSKFLTYEKKAKNITSNLHLTDSAYSLCSGKMLQVCTPLQAKLNVGSPSFSGTDSKYAMVGKNVQDFHSIGIKRKTKAYTCITLNATNLKFLETFSGYSLHLGKNIHF